MKTSLLMAGLAALSLGTSVPSALAQSGYNAPVTLTPGTVIPVKLDSELSSNNSQAGDTFTATVDDSKAAYRSIMQGATVTGRVATATAQSGNNPGVLSLKFTQLKLADGRTFSISGTPTSLDTKNLTTRSDGVLVAKSTKKNNALTYAGIGAGAAVLVDVLKGGKLNLQDILIGGGLGYGASVLLKGGQQQVHDVDLQSGTPMGVMLGTSTRYYYHRTGAPVHTTVKRHTVTTHHKVTRHVVYY